MRKINVPKYQPSQYKTKAAAVLDMLKGGETVKQIKNRMAVSDSYIYAMKKLMEAGVEAMVVETPKPAEFIQADTNVDAILDERATTYGSFVNVAGFAQDMKGLIRDSLDQQNAVLQADHQEALDMIASKLGRIIVGDPNHVDSWIDIAGYATLVADRLQGKIR